MYVSPPSFRIQQRFFKEKLNDDRDIIVFANGKKIQFRKHLIQIRLAYKIGNIVAWSMTTLHDPAGIQARMVSLGQRSRYPIRLVFRLIGSATAASIQPG